MNKRKSDFSDNLVIKRQKVEKIIKDKVPVALDNINDNLKEHYLGKMDIICIYCNAKFFKGERMLCCSNGLIKLNQIPEPPNTFKKLFDNKSEFSKEFKQKIRPINSIFSFTSLGENRINKSNSNKETTFGGCTYRVNGTLYHNIGCMKPLSGEKEKFSQIYFSDNSINLRYDSQLENNISKDLIKLIERSLEKNNLLVKEYKRLGLECINSPNKYLKIVDNFKHLDIRIFNKPNNNEQFGVLVPDNEDLGKTRDIVIQTQDSQLKQISYLHPMIDSLAYPILFPKGSIGWSPDMTYKNKNEKEIRITFKKYFNYHFQLREGSFNTFFKGDILTQQYYVNKFIDNETNKLEWYRNNQNLFRVDLYKGLMDCLNNKENLNNIGKMCILPASYYGSPRHLKSLYYDSMAIVGTLGRPDLFITVTANPNWREVKENLFDGQTSWQRFDLLCRVFHLKKNEILNDIKKKKYFGIVIGDVYVIEFQKRGLPHMHLLLILHEKNKLNTIEKINKCISAEIPDSNKYPKLHEKVSKLMIHTSCLNSSKATCLINGKCKSKFPFNYQEKTIITDDSYPQYQRRNNVKIEVNNKKIGNEYVVPYNWYLLLKYNCHINVEMCASIKAVKYLYKYIYKGVDHAMIEFTDFDECRHYQKTRYISSQEAYFRLNEYKLYDKNPTVIQLPVHLPNNQSIHFKSNDNIEELINCKKDTKLTKWFESNIKHPHKKHITYFEYPKYFRFEKNEWIERTYFYNEIIVRIYAISSKDTERFYLKLILKYKSGATSFDDLLTLNGIKYEKFKDLAKAMNLIENDDEWINTMNEIKFQSNAKYGREVFAYLLIFCELYDPKNLWNMFKKFLIEDYDLEFPLMNCFEKENLALIDINEILIDHDCKIEDFDLPLIVSKEDLSFKKLFDINEDDIKQFNYNFKKLTDQQLDIYQKIEYYLENNLTDCVFLDAPGGTGKTFLLNTIIIGMLIKKFKVLTVASSGIASTLLKNANTIHSTFNIPLNIKENDVCNINKNSKLAKFLKEINLIIFDEISMSHKFIFEAIDKSLKDITDCNKPFGNKLVIFSGDFKQILPIIKNGDEISIIDSCLKKSYLWSNIKNFKLTKNLRIKNNNTNNFDKFLLNLGNGSIEYVNEYKDIQIPEEFIFKDKNIDAFINYIFDIKDFNEDNIEKYSKTVILALLNEEVNELNNLILEKFKSNNEGKTYYSKDKLIDESSNLQIDEKVLNSINNSNLQQHELKLKTGAIVMIIRNLNKKKGLCNGTRGIIKKLGENIINIKVINGKSKGKIITIPKIWLIVNDDFPIKFKRYQFPIKLSFVMTINKAQGQSFEKLGGYLKNDCFGHGQLYVLFSRITSPKNLKIYLDDEVKKNY